MAGKPQSDAASAISPEHIGKVKVTWSLGTLQNAPSVVGPYTNMPTTSPFTNTASGTTFYRAKL